MDFSNRRFPNLSIREYWSLEDDLIPNKIRTESNPIMEFNMGLLSF